MAGGQDSLTALFIWREPKKFSSGAGGRKQKLDSTMFHKDHLIKFYNDSNRNIPQM